MRYIIIISLILLSSCGKINHNISGIDGTTAAVYIGPNFRDVATFCDDRYGTKTKEAEKCFKDYRNFSTLKISIDMDSIIAYCEQYYETEETNKIDACIDDLKDLFSALLNKKK